VATPPTRDLDVFDLSVLDAGSHVWVSASSSQGSVYGVPREPLAWTLAGEAADPSAWLAGSVRLARREAGADAVVVGKQLHDLVFGVPDIAALFQQTRGAAATRGAQVLLRLLAAPLTLSQWPWETILDPQRPDQFLAMARDVHVVRAGRARTYAVRAEPLEPPLNLLMVMSSPLPEGSTADETPFDLYEEKRALLNELRPLEDRGLLRIEVEDRPTMERLRERIGRQQRGFHVLHYLGHAQPAGLRLERANGRGVLVPSSRLTALLQQMPDLRLAVFAGCETARAQNDPAAGTWPGPLSIADLCVRDAAPMVVGMQAVLPFGTERLLTRFFYQALTAGQPVAEALRLARLAVADDEHTGGTLVNWAVPTLFVGGSLPGPVTDPGARTEPFKRPQRIALRLGARQRDLRFISRLTLLRQAVDVLSERSPARLLKIVGQPGSGKSSFLDRATEELHEGVRILAVSAAQLMSEDDPLGELCDLVVELLDRAGHKVSGRRPKDTKDWWDKRILEELTDVRLALVIDDADALTGEKGDRVVAALAALLQRRSRVRVAVASTTELVALTADLPSAHVQPVLLEGLDWKDVWQWIRRNQPVLARYQESDLSGYFSNLSRLEQWDELAARIEERANVASTDLKDIVDQIAASLPTTGSAPATPPPVFGGEPEPATAVAPGRPTYPTAPDAGRRSLRVAVAGQHTQNREAEFGRAVTQLAAEHWVSGRVVTSEGADVASSLAELLTLPSPFVDGAATFERIVTWMDQAATADVVVLDFGSEESSEEIEAAARHLCQAGRLVIAAGGNSGAPAYPAWIEDVLAVGALDEGGAPTAYSPHFPDVGKPDLYAPARVGSGAMADMLADPTIEGTSVAALNVAAAAIIVWATDRGQAADDVRGALLETARPVQPGDEKGPRALDVEAALAETRRERLLDSLLVEPAELSQILAETGLRPEVAVPLLDELVSGGRVTRTTTGGVEVFEDRGGLAQTYTQLRAGQPSSWERTRELGRVVRRAGDLARSGRITSAKVQSLWRSGQEGRRVVALGAIAARPDLGTLDIVQSGIGEPRSAFEHYHALLAGVALAPTLDTASLDRLVAAATAQLEGDELKGTDRAAVIRKLQKLGARE
jgi:hypothetical protein